MNAQLHILLGRQQATYTNIYQPLSAPCFSNNNGKYFHVSDFADLCFFDVNNSGLFLKRFSMSLVIFVGPSFTEPTVFLHVVYSTNDHAVRILIDECAKPLMNCATLAANCNLTKKDVHYPAFHGSVWSRSILQSGAADTGTSSTAGTLVWTVFGQVVLYHTLAR